MPGIIEAFAEGWVAARERYDGGGAAGESACEEAGALTAELDETRVALAH